MLNIFKSSNGVWLKACIVGVVFGILAQFLRQIPGALMYLGASTAPWVFVGFLLSFSTSRGVHTLRKTILIATVSILTYLVAWIVSYYLLFVVRESVTLADGWNNAAPWLFLTIPASPIIGTIAALSHKRGLLGDLSLAIPFAWSIPETIDSLSKGLMDGILFIITISLLALLLIKFVINERRINVFTMLTSIVILGLLGTALYFLVWTPLLVNGYSKLVGW
ncbi:hypothetical protein BGM26_04740 [Bacillus sp. FJAT-29790]|uniref:hypothetical protein n=1 Tax=Bacillus sp. FJAT-29790 TaxID=1895002 RepID=UPI001C23E46E|nr:hypothetical protein [Bacillus sp. FJAT-29790]MBU8878294.1 hypothetical protein [Bacillus sp. FJAT-29790]